MGAAEERRAIRCHGPMYVLLLLAITTYVGSSRWEANATIVDILHRRLYQISHCYHSQLIQPPTARNKKNCIVQ